MAPVARPRLLRPRWPSVANRLWLPSHDQRFRPISVLRSGGFGSLAVSLVRGPAGCLEFSWGPYFWRLHGKALSLSARAESECRRTAAVVGWDVVVFDYVVSAAVDPGAVAFFAKRPVLVSDASVSMTRWLDGAQERRMVRTFAYVRMPCSNASTVASRPLWARPTRIRSRAVAAQTKHRTDKARRSSISSSA